MEYAIETFSLTKVFSDWWGRGKVYAVDNLDLQIRTNEVFGLLGPNGSGKTTTLKMLLGLLYPTKGKALLLGGDSTDTKISARIGFMPEESYLYRYLTARETLHFYGSLFALPARVRKMRIEALLDMVGLSAVANRAVGTFSKGMARRIGLAQALINDPDLLILDEPTTGLDPIGTRQIKDLIIQLAKRGKTILLCSHLLADVEDVCDRIAILYSGKIQAEGEVRELLQQTDKTQITAGRISTDAVKKIEQIINDENDECVITSPMEKLETFFINTVTRAQQQARTTSGAVSTTQIGDFLKSGTDEESKRTAILDKLVSAPVSDKPAEPETSATESVARIETPKTKPNDELLDRLTKQSMVEQPKPVVSTDPVETEAEKSEQIRTNILDQLTNQSDTEVNEESDNTQAGDKGDA
jgi:ABC-2 type transport system ATP-binding protein